MSARSAQDPSSLSAKELKELLVNLRIPHDDCVRLALLGVDSFISDGETGVENKKASFFWCARQLPLFGFSKRFYFSEPFACYSSRGLPQPVVEVEKADLLERLKVSQFLSTAVDPKDWAFSLPSRLGGHAVL